MSPGGHGPRRRRRLERYSEPRERRARGRGAAAARGVFNRASRSARAGRRAAARVAPGEGGATCAPLGADEHRGHLRPAGVQRDGQGEGRVAGHRDGPQAGREARRFGRRVERAVAASRRENRVFGDERRERVFRRKRRVLLLRRRIGNDGRKGRGGDVRARGVARGVRFSPGTSRSCRVSGARTRRTTRGRARMRPRPRCMPARDVHVRHELAARSARRRSRRLGSGTPARAAKVSRRGGSSRRQTPSARRARREGGRHGDGVAVDDIACRAFAGAHLTAGARALAT